MKIGLIGKGAIGSFLLQKINEEKLSGESRIVAILDEREKAKKELPLLEERFGCRATYDLKTFLQHNMDVVMECANVETAVQYAPEVAAVTNLLLISIGALTDDQFRETVARAAELSGKAVYLPSGGIGGLDVIKAAQSVNGLASVSLTTRKPAHALLPDAIETEQIVFEGTAREAISKFPKNANVAITLSLAGRGADETEVKIIADPAASLNTHSIRAEGTFGTMNFTVENMPSPDNPKTSYLTALSVLSSLQSLESNIRIGV